MDEATIRAALLDHWRYEGIDTERSHELYADDAVLEFPQSGERFVGKHNFVAWRKRYPANLDFRVRRIVNHGPLWVAENLISYDGGTWLFTVSILQFAGDRIAHERVYVMDGFAPAEWRTPWVTHFDPLETITADDWREHFPGGQ